MNNISNFLENLKEWLPLFNSAGMIVLLLYYIIVIRDLHKERIKLQREHIDFLKSQLGSQKAPSFMHKQMKAIKTLAEEEIVRLTEINAAREIELKQLRSSSSEKKQLIQQHERETKELEVEIARYKRLLGKYQVYSKKVPPVPAEQFVSLTEIQKQQEILVKRSMQNVTAVVLAAGEGTRMEPELTKLAHILTYQALAKFAVDACVRSGIGRTIVVVGHQAERIRSILGEGFDYVYQEKRLGTGDALKRAIPLLEDFKGELVVLPGDDPFITGPILIQLVQYHWEKHSAATVLTAILADPSHYGRIIRDERGKIRRIIESSHASPEELAIKEVNSGIYCFDIQQVLPLLPSLEPNPPSGNYYLTDIFALLNHRGLRTEALMLGDQMVVLGVNTPEELERAWEIFAKRSQGNKSEQN